MNPGRMFQALKFGAAGLAGVGVGIWLVINPDMGLPPSGRRTLDVVPRNVRERSTQRARGIPGLARHGSAADPYPCGNRKPALRNRRRPRPGLRRSPAPPVLGLRPGPLEARPPEVGHRLVRRLIPPSRPPSLRKS